MTKLEELEAAYWDARDAWDTAGAEYAARGDAGRAAWNAARAAWKAADTLDAAARDAWNAARAAWKAADAWNAAVDDYDDAWVAYFTELKRTQKEDSND
jgi:hypothetical protein